MRKINRMWLKFERNCETCNQWKKNPCWSAEVSKKRLRCSNVIIWFLLYFCRRYAIQPFVCNWYYSMNHNTFNRHAMAKLIEMTHCMALYNLIISFSPIEKEMCVFSSRWERTLTILLVSLFSWVSIFSLCSYVDVVISFWHSYSHLSFAVSFIAG